MIIVTENNYNLLKNYQQVEKPKEEPDVVFYPEMFNNRTITQMLKLLTSLKFNDNNQIWMADDPNVVYNKNLQAQPFSQFIDKLRSDIEKVTDRSFNACLINKYSTGKKWSNTSYDWLETDLLFHLFPLVKQDKY